MSNPVLFIVAGPNGSGKSLFAKKLTAPNLEVFDGDKHMAALLKCIRKPPKPYAFRIKRFALSVLH